MQSTSREFCKRYCAYIHIYNMAIARLSRSYLRVSVYVYMCVLYVCVRVYIYVYIHRYTYTHPRHIYIDGWRARDPSVTT